MPYGVDDLLWDELIDHTADILGEVAAAGATIQYGQLSRKLHSRLPQVKLDPHYGAMPHLLEEVNVVVSRRDPSAPMISALVIGADTNEPGGGFYKAAQRLGYGVGDRMEFWLGQVQACHRWAGSS
jgi:hypothetical protein